jgi:hypothetical protein
MKAQVQLSGEKQNPAARNTHIVGSLDFATPECKHLSRGVGQGMQTMCKHWRLMPQKEVQNGYNCS